MKYLNTFNESIKDNPEIGDYVICKDQNSDLKLNAFLLENTGLCIDIIEPNPTKNTLRTESYKILYENIQHKYLSDNFFNQQPNSSGYRYMKRDEILYFSKNKEDLQIYIDTNKYNL